MERVHERLQDVSELQAYDLNVDDDKSGSGSSDYEDDGRRMRTLRGLLS